jgi:hypothetical protein
LTYPGAAFSALFKGWACTNEPKRDLRRRKEMELVKLLKTADYGWGRATQGASPPLSAHWIEEYGEVRSTPACAGCPDQRGHGVVTSIFESFDPTETDSEQVQAAYEAISPLEDGLCGVGLAILTLDVQSDSVDQGRLLRWAFGQ